MGETTAIEWTDATWNPWYGCDRVSPGCANCYADRDMTRYGRDFSVVTRSKTKFRDPHSAKFADQARAIREREGRRMRVFTCSWSDWFHEAADEWRPEAWEIVRQRPDFDFQILTKRPERVLDHLPADWGDGYPNVWLGTSIENRRFVHRADQLREIPAAVRFISAEPLLGPLLPDADHMVDAEHLTYPLGDAHIGCWREWADGYDGPGLNLEQIDWLIVGGESGPGHRQIKPEWVRELRDYCQEECWQGEREGVTNFFFKQWGGPRPDSGGRELDGRTWDEFPETRERMPV